MNGSKFTKDWFTGNIRTWERILEPMRGKPDLHFLEIGCFEGRATTWLLENILTDASSRITVIDTFSGSEEHGKDMSVGLEERFRKNIEPWKDKVTVKKGESKHILRTMEGSAFDVIYVDGSHLAADVLTDAVLSFFYLKKGGLMIFDDYDWRPYNEEWKMPRIAINGFLMAFANQIEHVHIGYQFIIKKI